MPAQMILIGSGVEEPRTLDLLDQQLIIHCKQHWVKYFSVAIKALTFFFCFKLILFTIILCQMSECFKGMQNLVNPLNSNLYSYSVVDEINGKFLTNNHIPQISQVR